MGKWTDNPWERQKNESAKALEAFSIYLNLGSERSITKVAQELNKTRTLIGRWSSEWSWQERVRAWENNLQREAHKAAVKKVRDMNARHEKMAVVIQGAAMEALKKIGSDMVTPKNFAAIVRLATELERKSLIESVDSVDENTDGEEEETVRIYLPDNGRMEGSSVG